jgi:hypothetical protein
VSRGRRPGWYIAVIVAVFVGVLGVLLLGGTDLFHRSKWDSAKAPLREMVPLWFAVASVAGVVPALPIVGHYRNKLEQSKGSL